nr:hypothetical protein [Candidatus Njordarchaeota archaeon]
MREREIKETIIGELRTSFHVMTENEILRSIGDYKSVRDKIGRMRRMKKRVPPPTDYNKDVIAQFKSRQKAMKSITEEVEEKIVNRFGIEKEKVIKGTEFRIDLFDTREKVCYEICLGDGAEIFKDLVKALIVEAKKLVMFCRSYPNPWGMTGYGYAKRHWDMLKKSKLNLEAEIVNFMS